MTAANSTPLTDGASAVLLASEEWAASHNLKPMAYLTFGQHYAINFVDEAKGLLIGSHDRGLKMLDQAGLTLQDFDFYGIHEAFAAQVLCTLKASARPEIIARPCSARTGARLHRPREDEREGVEPCLRSPLCRNRRPDYRHARQGPRRNGAAGA